MHALLLALILSTSFSDRLAPYRGHPVLSVDIVAPQGENPKELRSLVDIEQGYLLRTEDIQTSIKRLYSLGRFSNVSVFAKRLKGTILLTFTLLPLQRIESIRLTGLSGASKEKVIKALPVARNDEADSRTADTLHRAVLEKLKRTGYQNATAEITLTPSSDHTRVRIQIDVQPNAPEKISEVYFSGNTRAPRELLHSLIKSRPGGILNAELLQSDVKSITSHYLKKGFRTVSVDDPVVVPTSSGALINLRITAGDRISLEFTGNHLLSRARLLELWPDASGRLRRGDLRTFENRIRSYYKRAGYPNTEVTVQGFQNKEVGSRRYLFQIQEGLPVLVKSVSFSGNEAIPTENLLAHIHSRLEESLTSEALLQPITPKDQQAILFGDSTPNHYFGQSVFNVVPDIPSSRRWVRDVYDNALRELTAVYQDRGFIQAQVGPLQTQEHEGGLQLHIPIKEGTQAFIRSISFKNHPGVSSAELLNEIEQTAKVSPGDPFSSSRQEDARISLIRKYRNNGYLYAKVFATEEFSAGQTAVDIHFSVEEGPQVHLDRILIRGNQHTSERLIRSRMQLRSQKSYQLDKALDSQRAIASLGVFSSVKLRLIDEETPGERKDLIAEVIEIQRHKIQTIGGISTEDGPRIGVTYSHLNLFGTASTLTTSAKLNRQLPQFFSFLYGSQGDSLQQRYAGYSSPTAELTKALERELRLGLRSPQFVALPLSPLLRLDFTDIRDNKTSYSLDSGAATFGVELFFNRHLKMAVDPRLSITRVECTPPLTNCGELVQKDTQTSSKDINQGSRVGISLGSTLTYDLRDDPFNPHRGFILSLSGHYALGGFTEDLNNIEVLDQFQSPSYIFTKMEARGTGYIPIKRAVLALAVWGGAISMQKGGLEDTPLDERFFLGGRSDLRGFQEESLIPEDACYQKGETDPECRMYLPAIEKTVNGKQTISSLPSLGGNFYLLTKAELRLPLSNLVTLDLFLDSGNLWMYRPNASKLKLRFGTGIGVGIATPVGPLSFSIGFNPGWRANNLETPAEYYFSIGKF